MDGLRRLVRVLRSANSNTRRQAGITSAQLFVLRHIAENPGRSLDDVVRRTLTTQSAASEVVARLVGRGLVTSEPTAADRRRVALAATAAGEQVLQESAPPIQDTLIAALHSLPASQQDAIADGLAAWLVAANLAGVAPSMFFEPEERARASKEIHVMSNTSDLSVNEIIRRYPAALPVLNEFAIDTCCGGEEPLRVAAVAANAPLAKIIAAITEAARETV
jgi:DNA-binding MarR family transcriptional regulator